LAVQNNTRLHHSHKEEEMNTGAVLVGDAFWGDSGKGKGAAWLALMYSAQIVLRGGGGPNAEHGIFVGEHYVRTNQLPLSWILAGCPIAIGSGTAVDPVKLLSEMERFGLGSDRVHIDPRCPIVESRHIAQEVADADMEAIGSTKSGTGATLVEFLRRGEEVRQAKDVPQLAPLIQDVVVLSNKLARDGVVVVEDGQGFWLSSRYGEYPNVTSKNCTTGAMIDAIGLGWRLIGEVWLMVKSKPTREGKGGMGKCRELTLKEMRRRGLVEASSIGGVPRRKVDGIDFDLLKYAVMVNAPTHIALTFAEHHDPEVSGVTSADKLTPKTRELIARVERETGVPVGMVDTGKQFNHVVSIPPTMPIPELDEKTLARLASYVGR